MNCNQLVETAGPSARGEMRTDTTNQVQRCTIFPRNFRALVERAQARIFHQRAWCTELFATLACYYVTLVKRWRLAATSR
jgi:hypothetical protein